MTINIDINDLIYKIELYNKCYELMNEIYNITIKKIQNSKLNLLTIYNTLILFLTTWGQIRIFECLFKNKLSVIEICKQLLSKLRKYQDVFDRLKMYTIVDIDLNHFRKEIISIFNDLMKIPCISSTSISKILHVLHPRLFPIWDDEIRMLLKIEDTGNDYIKYMSMVQEIIRKLNVNVQEIENRLRMYITRIITTYLWIIARKEIRRIDIVKECESLCRDYKIEQMKLI